jgi:isoprenylcysteine carboxyl methyltransferase (ICMT) family protein YpbQ
VGIFAMLGVCVLISTKLKNTRIGSGIKWFGQNSFIAMSIHNPIKSFVIFALAAVLKKGKMTIMGGAWTALLALLVTLVVTVAIMIIIVWLKRIWTDKKKVEQQ